MPQSKYDEKYAHSRQKVFSRLINRAVFTEMHEEKAAGHRIYRSRFINEVKNKGTPEAFEISRPFIMDFSSKTAVFTHAPTVQRASRLLQLSVAPNDETLIFPPRHYSGLYAIKNETMSNYLHPPAFCPSVSSKCSFSRELPTIWPARIWGSLVFYIPQISHNITPYEPLDLRSVLLIH